MSVLLFSVSKPPQTLDELGESLTLWDKLNGGLGETEAKFPPLHDQFSILEKYEVPIKEEVTTMLSELSNDWIVFQQKLIDAEQMLKKHKVWLFYLSVNIVWHEVYIICVIYSLNVKSSIIIFDLTSTFYFQFFLFLYMKLWILKNLLSVWEVFHYFQSWFISDKKQQTQSLSPVYIVNNNQFYYVGFWWALLMFLQWCF